MHPPFSPSSAPFDCVVVGGGPAGLAAALALADAGAHTALIARRVTYADNRTTALFGASLELLERLDVWRRCVAEAEALRVMRLVDDTARLIRAPEVRFDCNEIGLETFGYNIENHRLVAALEMCCDEAEAITRIDDEAASISHQSDMITVVTKSGREIQAALVVGADGRQSMCREAAGIAVTRRDLKQAALTFNIEHERPHRNVSTEFHTAHGPCVFVPLPGNRSSVVWVSTPEGSARLQDMSDEALSEAAERQSHSILGKVRVQPGRHRFPLVIEQPERLAAQRIVLVGEAAHVIPPIGAQGLNLGLRDAADLGAVIAACKTRGDDPGGKDTLSRFESARRADVLSRIWAVDLANRTLLGEMLPVQAFRAIGIHLLAAVGPLRRLAMREGLQPSWPLRGGAREESRRR